MKEENGGIVVNKYGAVDVKEIVEIKELLKDTRLLYVKILRSLVEKEISWETYPHLYESVNDYCERVSKIFIEDFNKMKVLTKADDYEFKTTTETTLVKKEVLENEQL